MPQQPIGAYVAKNSANTLVPLKVDASGSLLVDTATAIQATISGTVPVTGSVTVSGTVNTIPESVIAQGAANALRLTTQTVVKATAGLLLIGSVIVGGTTTGTINDAASASAAGSTNEVAVIPTAVGSLQFGSGFPCTSGIVVTPASGQAISIGYL